MNRTGDFLNEIRSVKKRQLLAVETHDIIRPTIEIAPFLKDGMKLVVIVCCYKL